VTLGNLLMIAGLYLLFYVGGVYVQIDYQRMAARGDNNLSVPRAVISVPNASSAPRIVAAQPMPREEAFVAPVLSGGQIVVEENALPIPLGSTVERLIIPAVALDAKVIEVGWQVVEQNGQQLAIWDVAEYAVGHHKGSANPGEGENVVLAGHVGGYGHVFRDLYYVKPGHRVLVYSQGQEYLYIVTERLIVPEDNAPPEQRAENAKLIGAQGQEMITMVTCWPPTGEDKFTERVIIRAVPYAANVAPLSDAPPASTIR
jgi:LPXTG-site transpeptidase (sortase) family protein